MSRWAKENQLTQANPAPWLQELKSSLSWGAAAVKKKAPEKKKKKTVRRNHAVAAFPSKSSISKISVQSTIAILQ